MTRLTAVAALVAAWLVFSTAAEADLPGIDGVSPNWSGYVATASPASGTPVAFTKVTGTWTVPLVRCIAGDGGAASAAWVGLGGYLQSSNRKVEQVGTNANCDSPGKPAYFAWFEVVPYPAYTIKSAVLPGDQIDGAVTILPNLVELKVVNRTRHWSFTRRISWSGPDTSSAEWIVEAPSTCLRFDCTQAPLANFRSLTFRGISATGNSAQGTLTSSAWTANPVELVPGSTMSFNLGAAGPPGAAGAAGAAPTPPNPALPPSSSAGARPGTISADGRTFTIEWLPDATGG